MYIDSDDVEVLRIIELKCEWLKFVFFNGFWRRRWGNGGYLVSSSDSEECDEGCYVVFKLIK